MQYRTVNEYEYKYEWKYPTNETTFYEIAPGRKIGMDHGGPVLAQSIRIWANEVGGTLRWHKYKDSTLDLVKDEGYVGPLEDFVFRFH